MINYFCNKNKRGSIGVIDSGVGGITVLSSLMQKLPKENFIYLADKSGAPYGDKSESYILSRTVAGCINLIERGVKAIVIACNTATNVGISTLRGGTSILSRYVYVGLEPAVRPALRETKDGKILVLLTPATSRQKKFLSLIDELRSDRIIVSPQDGLATLIEENIYSLNRIRDSISDILSKYDNVGAVVLGCTHYVYLREIISDYYEGNVKIFDGNEGAANRLGYILNQQSLENDGSGGCVEFIIT